MRLSLQVIKVLALFTGLIQVVCGIILLSKATLFITTWKNHTDDLDSTNLLKFASFCLVLSVLIGLTASFAIFGVCIDSYGMIITYLIAKAVILVCVFAFVSALKSKYNPLLFELDYNLKAIDIENLNTIERHFECCGFEKYTDYFLIWHVWNTDDKNLPVTEHIKSVTIIKKDLFPALNHTILKRHIPLWDGKSKINFNFDVNKLNNYFIKSMVDAENEIVPVGGYHMDFRQDNVSLPDTTIEITTVTSGVTQGVTTSVTTNVTTNVTTSVTTDVTTNTTDLPTSDTNDTTVSNVTSDTNDTTISNVTSDTNDTMSNTTSELGSSNVTTELNTLITWKIPVRAPTLYEYPVEKTYFNVTNGFLERLWPQPDRFGEFCPFLFGRVCSFYRDKFPEMLQTWFSSLLGTLQLAIEWRNEPRLPMRWWWGSGWDYFVMSNMNPSGRPILPYSCCRNPSQPCYGLKKDTFTRGCVGVVTDLWKETHIEFLYTFVFYVLITIVNMMIVHALGVYVKENSKCQFFPPL